MKKKVILTGLLLTMCVGLTACGNPLKQLPEATEENIYDEDEETTGNEAADEIIDVLTDEDEGGVDGDVVSFTVYDREDDDDKDKSEVYVEIIIEGDEFEYTGYYIVEMKYDKEDGWEVDEFETDEDEDCLFKPLEGPDEDILWDTIYYSMDEFYIDDMYFYILSDNMGDIEVLSEDIYEEDGVFYDEMKVEFEYIDYDCSYIMEYTITYVYYFESYSQTGTWYYYDGEYPTSYEID